MVASTVLAAIGTIIIGIFTAKPFLIFIGIALFMVPFLITASLTGTWWIILVVVLVIILILTEGKRKR